MLGTCYALSPDCTAIGSSLLLGLTHLIKNWGAVDSFFRYISRPEKMSEGSSSFFYDRNYFLRGVLVYCYVMCSESVSTYSVE